MRVILIDDDEALLKILEDGLSQSGYTISIATNGSLINDVIDAHDPDVVITDILMPRKEGIETIIDIKSKRPELPIIAMSGGGHMSGDTVLGLANSIGADATILKPFRIGELINIIEYVTRNKHNCD